MDISKVRLGMTREKIKALFGEPDDIANGTRKYPEPVYKYGDIEFGFVTNLIYVMEAKTHKMLLTGNKNGKISK